jgi:flagellar motor switch protein FliG
VSESKTAVSGLRKAAIVLVALGPAESARVLKHLPEEEANRVTRAIAQLELVSLDQLRSVLEEFGENATAHQLSVRGGLDYAEKMLTEAYGQTAAQTLGERVSKSFAKGGFNFDNFRKADPQQLAKLIQDEHPQTIALILSHLDPSQAANLLSSIPSDTQMDVAIRMASLDQISPEVVRSIATVIEHKLRSLGGELSREACGGVRAVANIFNRLDPNTCSKLMDAIENTKQPLFENIRQFMFVFRDLEGLDNKAIGALISRAQRSTLIVALKGADESLRKKFVSTQSQRGADMLLEELSSLGPVKLKDVDAAQQEIIALAREMEKEGAISLKNSSDEQYIY